MNREVIKRLNNWSQDSSQGSGISITPDIKSDNSNKKEKPRMFLGVRNTCLKNLKIS